MPPMAPQEQTRMGSATKPPSSLPAPGFASRRIYGIGSGSPSQKAMPTRQPAPPSSIAGSFRSASSSLSSGAYTQSINTSLSRSTASRPPRTTPDKSRAASMNPSIFVSPTPHSRSVSMGARPTIAGVGKLVSSPRAINPPAHAVAPDRSSPSGTVIPTPSRDTPNRGGKPMAVSPVPALAISSPAKIPPAPPQNSNYAATQVTPTTSRRVNTANSGTIDTKRKSSSPNPTLKRINTPSNISGGGTPSNKSPQSNILSPGSSDATLSLTNGASGLTNPFVTMAAVSRMESPSNSLHLGTGSMHEFPMYGGHSGDVSFGSGTSARAGTGDDSTELDMITDDGEVDEELKNALNTVEDIYTQRITHYRRLLERAQSSSAQQLLALEAALSTEKARAADAEAEAKKLKERLEKANKSRPPLGAYGMNLDFGNHSFDIVSAMRGDGFGGFDEQAIRASLKAMRQADRMRLLHILLDSCLPGDVPLMISLLNRYALTSFDIMTNLPTALSSMVLSYLRLPELLSAELVSKKWLTMSRQDELYELLVRRLTKDDPVPVQEPHRGQEGGWRLLYQALYHRERNWAWGNPQSIKFLKGHTGFCTTLKLRGNRLMSGSYDETIRLWNIDTGEQEKCIKVKAVSCIDYLVEHEVFAVGFHDVGRVQVISSLTWSALQTLQGHLYGIRAVALSPSYMVSAGADKAIVVWEWRTGKKLVRFGQQINMCIGVQIMQEDRIVSVTIDGSVRVFSIGRREMLSQFQLNTLTIDDPIAALRLSSVGVGPNNMLQWFAANGRKMTCATKNVIIHLTWSESPTELFHESPSSSTIASPTVATSSFKPDVSALRQRSVSGHLLLLDRKRPSLSLSTSTSPLSQTSSTPTKVGTPVDSPSPSVRRTSMLGASTSKRPVPPPRVSSIGPDLINAAARFQRELPTLDAVLETPDVSCGAVDPLKRRVVTSTRFSSRLGADRRMFVSTYDETRRRLQHRGGDEESNPSPTSATSAIDFDSLPRPPTPTGPVVHDVSDRPPIAQITGAWAALADEASLATAQGVEELKLHGRSLPNGFKGLATPEFNPMALALSHEKVVVGCTDGTIYVMNLVGHSYPVSVARERALASALLTPSSSEEESDQA